jgi:hypothetical protein
MGVGSFAWDEIIIKANHQSGFVVTLTKTGCFS